jgi:hypothetical protein
MSNIRLFKEKYCDNYFLFNLENVYYSDIYKTYTSFKLVYKKEEKGSFKDEVITYIHKVDLDLDNPHWREGRRISNQYGGYRLTIGLPTNYNRNNFCEVIVFQCIIVHAIYKAALKMPNKKKRIFIRKFDNDHSYFFEKK